jgi:O-antigen ligase
MVRLALPALLLLFFVWRSLNERIFLLGIPFLMYMTQAVFFSRVKIFWVPARLEPADHVKLWLVIVWVVYFDLLLPARRRQVGPQKLFGPRLSVPEEVLLLVLAGYCALEFGLTVQRFGGIGSAIGEAKGFVYLFLGYFLLRGMLSRAGRTQTIHFLAALVGVNTLAALLFVAHQGLHISIYDVTEYQTITFMGQQLTRSFYFMPQLLILATAFSIAQRRWTVWWVAVFVITLATLWISYTRSLLVIAIVEVAIILGLRLLKSREAGRAVRRGLTIVGIVAVFVVLAFAFLPVQSQYLLSRIDSTTAGGNVASDTNLQNRQHKMERVYAWITPESRLLGQGFASSSQVSSAGNLEWMSADLVWVPVLYRLGLVGLAVVLGLFAAYGWRALSLSSSGTGDAEFLGVVFLGSLAGLFLEGFVSWTLLNPERYPMGLWLFAFVAAEACRRRQEAATASAEPVAVAAEDAPRAARPEVAAASLAPPAGGAGD